MCSRDFRSRSSSSKKYPERSSTHAKCAAIHSLTLAELILESFYAAAVSVTEISSPYSAIESQTNPELLWLQQLITSLNF